MHIGNLTLSELKRYEHSASIPVKLTTHVRVLQSPAELVYTIVYVCLLFQPLDRRIKFRLIDHNITCWLGFWLGC